MATGPASLSRAGGVRAGSGRR